MIIDNASLQDSKDIFNWRNDQKTRAMYVKGEEITWQHHSEWFSKVMKSPNNIIYIGRDKKSKTSIGMVRFDIIQDQNLSEVSINLNPIWRGKRVSSELLSGAIKQFKSIYDIPILAKVKKKNIASVKCFERSLFQLEDKDEDYYYFGFK